MAVTEHCYHYYNYAQNINKESSHETSANTSYLLQMQPVRIVQLF